MEQSTPENPNIYILATGGTIAGSGHSAVHSKYTAGGLPIESLLTALPQLAHIANIQSEQVVKIGSQDMDETVWLLLARRVNELLERDDVDAVVVTHGTDTMEETAYFLNLTIHSEKPVVLVGSMSPSTALSADGPINLYDAVVTAAAPQSRGKGVLITMNGIVLTARGATKTNTVDVQTFQSPDTGPLGYIHNGKVFYNFVTLKKHTTESIFSIEGVESLPRVGIVYGHAGIAPDVLAPFLKEGAYQGIVYAGVGNGNIYRQMFAPLGEARRRGIVVVRATRVPTGPVTRDAEVDDEHYQFVAAQELNPQKARVLLMLALTRTRNWQQIQELFDEY